MSWLKQFRVYKLTEAISADLSTALREVSFVPCGPNDRYHSGFVPPVPEGTDLIHSANGFVAFTFKQQEKIIPGQTVRELVEARAQQLAADRPVGRKERQVLKDEVIFELLPKAFTRSTVTEAYIDTKHGLIIVGTASAPRAEALLSKLRDAIGTLRCIPVALENPARTMTTWVKESTPPHGFALGEEVSLRHPKDHSVVTCKFKDLTSTEVLNHVANHMYVTSLALCWKDRVSFVINEAFSFSKVAFSFEVTDADDSVQETAAEQFDADFVLMTAELRALIINLLPTIDNPVS